MKNVKDTLVSYKINDKTNLLTRVVGLFILALEYTKGNRNLKPLNEAEVKSDKTIISRELRNKGVCTISDFVSESNALSLKNQLLKIIEKCMKNDLRDGVYENDNYLIQRGPKKLSTYDELQEYNKTVFHIRDTEEDKGFIDIFNVDLLFKNKPFFKEILDKFETMLIEENLQKVLGKSVKRSNLNVYITPTLPVTRCLHIDSLKKDAKLFIYLSDVSKLKNGPYGYVLGSHKYNIPNYIWMKLHPFLAKIFKYEHKITDSVFFKTKDAFFLKGKPGTLICSLQNGTHRGFPQTSSTGRVVFVAHYE